MQLGKLTDDLYNRRTFNAMRAPQTIDLTGVSPEVSVAASRPQDHITGGHRFSVTNKEKCVYNIICGLAHSQWSWYVLFLLFLVYSFLSSFVL